MRPSRTLVVSARELDPSASHARARTKPSGRSARRGGIPAPKLIEPIVLSDQAVNAGNADTLPPSAAFNYTRDVVDRLASERPSDEALRALSGTGGRRSYTFENVRREAARVSGGLARAGVRKGDVVMTLLGARPEWVFTMLGAWRLGAIALPCSEQLRRKEMAFRAKAAMPRVIVSAGRDMEELDAALSLLEAQFTCIDVDSTPERLFSDEEAPAADTSPAAK